MNVGRMKLSALALLFWLLSYSPACCGFKSSWKPPWLWKKTRNNYCDQVGKQGVFDQYILAEQYSSVLCQYGNNYSCDNLKEAAPWTLHGLWPSYRHIYGGADEPMGPSCCDPNGTFDQDSLQSLLPRLRKEWTNLSGDSYGFWKHEWMKHGTCSPTSLQPEIVYFSKVLDLYEKRFRFDLLLQRANILPSRTKLPASRIVAAFEEKYGEGVVSEIICSNNMMLKEIRICLDKDTFNPTKCLGRRYVGTSTCGGGYGIIYPPSQLNSYFKFYA